MDANGESWETEAFLHADRFVQEGLANYFSWKALQGNDDWWLRDALRALEALWPRQPPPYREFDHWRRSITASPETVRAAVRRARERGLSRDQFRELLER